MPIPVINESQVQVIVCREGAPPAVEVVEREKLFGLHNRNGEEHDIWVTHLGPPYTPPSYPGAIDLGDELDEQIVILLCEDLQPNRLNRSQIRGTFYLTVDLNDFDLDRGDMYRSLSQEEIEFWLPRASRLRFFDCLGVPVAA